MLFLASVILFILKVTAFPALSWWIVALPALIGVGIWVGFLVVAGIAAILTWKFLD